MTGGGRARGGSVGMAASREVRSLRRGLTALGLVNAERTMSIARLALALGLPRTTAERLLHTLVAAGYLERTADDKQYRPTALVLTLSSGFVPRSGAATAQGPVVAPGAGHPP